MGDSGPEHHSKEKGYSGKYVVLSVTTLAQLMAAIDATIVFLAVPSMGSYFHTDVSYMTLVVVSYIIASTAMLLPTGNIGQKYGRRKPFLLGFLIFSVSSLSIALSPNIIWAIVFRAIEGFGAALMLALAIPILLSAFPPDQRGKAVGISSTSWSIGALLGPLLGGVLVAFSWKYIFLINVPIGIAGIILGIKRIPKDKGHTDVDIRPSNVLGLLVFLVPVVVGISFLNTYWLAFSAVMFPLFLLSQRKHALVPTKLLKNRSYYPIVIAASLQGIGFLGTLYVLSVFFQSDLGFSSMAAGLAVAPFPAASILGTPIGGYLLDRGNSGGKLMVLGLLGQGFSILTLPMLLNNVYIMTIPLIVAGFSGSVFWSVSTTLSVDVSGDKFRNQASGTLFTVRSASLIIGISLLATFIGLFSPSSSTIFISLGQSSNLLKPVDMYLLFLAMLSFASSIIIHTVRKRWNYENKKDETASRSPEAS